jgi:hypothetical protein
MKKLPNTKIFAVAIIVAAVATGIGIVIAAAENPANDCLVGIEDESEAQLSGTVTCTDGDPTCDADGAANGTCDFKIRGCINIPDVAGCTLRPIKKVKFKTPHAKNLIVLTPVSGQATSACGAFVDWQVPLKKKGKKPGKRNIIAMALADVKPAGQNKDKDKIQFVCNPCTTGNCSGGGTTTTTLGNCSNPQGGPDQMTLTIGNTGNDLDTGFTGQSHNFLNVSGSQLKFCLTGCDASTNSTCQAAGSAQAADSLNGPAFGAPLPLFSAGVAVCVVNRFQDTQIQGVVNVATGAFDGTATPLGLLSDTYQGTSNQVCPKCVSGKCDSGKNQGANCQVDGTVVVNNPPNVNNVTYNLSKSCLPATSNLLGTPNVKLPLTTGTSTLSGNANGNGFPCPGQSKHDECSGGTCTADCSAKPDPKGGINQTCCAGGGAAGLPCFPTAPGTAGMIARTGSAATPTPAWPDPTYPKSASGTLASTFCIPATGSTTVDATAGLAGPGASLLAGTVQFTKNP